MKRSGRVLALVLVALVVAGACTSGKSKNETSASGKDTKPAAAPAGINDTDAIKAAEKWLDDWKAIDRPTRQALKETKVVHTPKVAHVHFNQVYDGHAVRGAEVIVNVLDNGTVQSVGNSVAKVDDPGHVEAKVDEQKAKTIASKAVTDKVDGDPNAKVVWLQDGRRLRLGWSVGMATQGTSHRSWTVWVDAVTGAVADARESTFSETTAAAAADAGVPASAPAAVPQAGGSRCQLKDGPSACVFLVDPIYSDGGQVPSLADANKFLTGEPLQGLKDAKSGALVGEFVNLEPPNVQPVRQPGSRWNVGRGDPGFEAVMAYFWIDHTQRLLQKLGFTNVRNEPFPVQAIEPDTKDNSFFDSQRQEIFLGVDSRGTTEGEDASGIIHEYGHAVLDQQANGFRNNAEQSAYHEAFGDLLAVLSTLEFRNGDVACMFPWPTEDTRCLRRIDTTNRYPDDMQGEEHIDSAIPSSAVFEVLTKLLDKDGIDVRDCAKGKDCTAVRDRVLTTLLATNASLPPTATLPDIAAAFEQTNQAIFGGQDADLIHAAFADHGLDQPGAATVDGNGQAGSSAKVAVDLAITHEAPGDLTLTLGVVDAQFKDLCPEIPLKVDAPEGATDIEARLDLSDNACAKFLPPGPDQQWVLAAADKKKGNTGRIDAFRVFDGETPFLATGVPQPIADNDPDGTGVIINGSGKDVPQEGQEGIEQGATTGSVTATIAITHSNMGDLSVRAGVADANGSVLCSVPILDPDPANSDNGAKGDVDLGKCAKFFPPNTSRQWFLQVIDTASGDTGTVDDFSVTGPDGVEHRSRDAGADIPDDDEAGAVLFVTA